MSTREIYREIPTIQLTKKAKMPKRPPSSSPRNALAQLSRHPHKPLIVNSNQVFLPPNINETFLDQAQPSSLAATVLAALDRVKPWRLIPGGNQNREWVRVLSIIVLMPWTLIGWRRSAQAWSSSNNNQAFSQPINAHTKPVVIVTETFDVIAKPVLAAIGFRNSISCPLFRWRGQRHLTSAERFADSDFAAIVPNAVVLTSPKNDEHLVISCENPILTSWPKPTAPPTLSHAYIPLRYVHNTKNPHRRFIRFAWLQDDLYMAFLAYSFVGLLFPLQMIAIALASTALWVSYEVSYHDNDVLGAERESEPMLPSNFDHLRGSVPTVAPWVWAGGFSAAAGFFAAVGTGKGIAAAPLLAGAWFGVIVGIALMFAFFNRLKKPARVIPHLILQVGKYFGYAVLSSLNPVGAALALAQVVYRWFPYAIYRWHKSRTFVEEPLTRTRLAIFWVMSVPFVVQNPSGLLLQFTLGSLYFGRRAFTTHLKLH